MNHQEFRSKDSPIRWVLLVGLFVVAGALPMFAATKSTKTTTRTSSQIIIRPSRVANAAHAVVNRLGRATAAVGNIWRVRGDRPINLGPSNPAGGQRVTVSGAINNVTAGTAVGRATSGMGVNNQVGPVNATIDIDADEIFNNDLGQSVAAGPVIKTGAVQAIGGGGGGDGVVVVGGGVVGTTVVGAPSTIGGSALSASTAVGNPEFATAGTPATGIAGPGATIGIAGTPSTIGGPNVMGTTTVGTVTGFVGGNSTIVSNAPLVVTPVVTSSRTTNATMAVGVAENNSSTSAAVTTGNASGNIIIPSTTRVTTGASTVSNSTTGSRSRGVRAGGNGTTGAVMIGGGTGGGTISVPSRGLTMAVNAAPGTTAAATINRNTNQVIGRRVILGSEVLNLSDGSRVFVDTARVAVPASSLSDIAILSPDITVDPARGIITVQSSSEATNLALINLVNDIVTGRRTGTEALNVYNAILTGHAGYRQYTQRILFIPQP